MTGEEAIQWIHAQYGLGNKEGLTNTAVLLGRLGDPQNAYPCVHVAGTNGKGSICSMIASALKACGYRVGLYTSPYLERYNERIRVDTEPIADAELGEVATTVRVHVEALAAEGKRATVFEIGTACAFEHLRRAQVDIAVIEVGMGGIEDATNVITPVLSVIGRIGMDHENALGSTLEEIAFKKAGIVKPGVPCVLYPQPDPARAVIRKACLERNAPYISAERVSFADLISTERGHRFTALVDKDKLENVSIALPGDHQIDNARTAIAALMALRAEGFVMTNEGIVQGLERTTWPGRLEWFGNVLLDGAHNEQGARALADYVQRYLCGRKVVAVCGVQRGKAIGRIGKVLAGAVDEAFCVVVEGHRANNPYELAGAFMDAGKKAGACESVAQALALAKAAAGQDGIVLVCGSLYLCGEVRGMLAARQAQI